MAAGLGHKLLSRDVRGDDSFPRKRPALGARLKLPSRWRYETIVPSTDLVVGAQGEAIVVQDDLDNTYQKLD